MERVNRYEALVLFDVGISDEKLDQLILKIEEMIRESEGGELLNLDRWGKKRLAYEIRKRQFGYYVLYEFSASASFPAELDRFARIESGILRHLCLAIPDRVLKLKAREEKIRVALEARRLKAAEKDGPEHVEDMLQDEPPVDHEVDFSDEGLDDDSEASPAEVEEDEADKGN